MLQKLLSAASGSREHRRFLIITVIINPVNSFKDKNLIKLTGQVIYNSILIINCFIIIDR